MFDLWLRSRRRKRLLSQPLPGEWLRYLRQNVAIFEHLPPDLQERLIKALQIIVNERSWVGCKGLLVTDEMKVTIAAQAALLLLGEEGYYFERVRAFLLYPYKMLLPAQRRHHLDDDDMEGAVIEGQAFAQGEIVLSWPDALDGGQIADDGQNVVLHELAHHLDGLDGEMGGHLPGLGHADQLRWHQVLAHEMDRLQQDLANGARTLIDPFAADNAAEFFAYSTECFFERPISLRTRHRELYACLQRFYKVDPAAWFVGKD